jgi:biopolymer transport protein ExbB
MKKLIALIAVLGMLYITASNVVVAQDTPAVETEVQTEEVAPAPVADPIESVAAQAEQGQSLHSALKQKFIEGGPGFMSSILVALILGLALSIERVVYLNLATSNNKKLLEKIEEALNTGGIEAAKEV